MRPRKGRRRSRIPLSESGARTYERRSLVGRIPQRGEFGFDAPAQRKATEPNSLYGIRRAYVRETIARRPDSAAWGIRLRCARANEGDGAEFPLRNPARVRTRDDRS